LPFAAEHRRLTVLFVSNNGTRKRFCFSRFNKTTLTLLD
jgi:hypothetical protein